MSTPVERPPTPPIAGTVGAVLAVIIGFLILKLILGFVFTIAKLAIVLGLVVGAVWFVNQLSGDD